jgi:hypothetical protein
MMQNQARQRIAEAANWQERRDEYLRLLQEPAEASKYGQIVVKMREHAPQAPQSERLTKLREKLAEARAVTSTVTAETDPHALADARALIPALEDVIDAIEAEQQPSEQYKSLRARKRRTERRARQLIGRIDRIHQHPGHTQGREIDEARELEGQLKAMLLPGAGVASEAMIQEAILKVLEEAAPAGLGESEVVKRTHARVEAASVTIRRVLEEMLEDGTLQQQQQEDGEDIEVLGLEPRVEGALRAAGIRTVEHAREVAAESGALEALEGIGRAYARRIREALEEHGDGDETSD